MQGCLLCLSYLSSCFRFEARHEFSQMYVTWIKIFSVKILFF
jgi:hypothetical protein